MKKLLTLASAVLPASLFAHSGHGILEGNNFFHYILNWEHGIFILPIVGAIVYFMSRKRQKLFPAKGKA